VVNHWSTLNVGQADIFDNVALVRGNISTTVARGGIQVPKAGLIIGNEFPDVILDARVFGTVPIVAYNRFVSSSGAFTIGPQPEFSFVVEIVQTRTNGCRCAIWSKIIR